MTGCQGAAEGEVFRSGSACSEARKYNVSVIKKPPIHLSEI